MHKRFTALLLLLSLIALCVPAFAQDTYVTVTDAVGGTYRLPLSNCPTQGMTYTRSTNSFGCASGATYPAPGSNTQVLFNDSGLIGADAGFTYVKGTGTATLTALALTTALPATSGGTGFAAYTIGDLLYADTTNSLAKLADVAAGKYLRSGGVATAPVWSTATLPNTAVTGDLLYASATSVYSNLADVTAGSYLRSGGVTTAPLWSTLTLPNAATTGDVLYASASNVVSTLADVAAGSYLRSGGATTAPVWSTTTLPNSATTGDVLYASASNVYSNLAAVATGSYLRSAGTSTAPVWSTTTLPNSATTGDLLYASASNVYSNLADVATGQVLVSGGAGTAPAWSANPTVTTLTATRAVTQSTGTTAALAPSYTNTMTGTNSAVTRAIIATSTVDMAGFNQTGETDGISSTVLISGTGGTETLAIGIQSTVNHSSAGTLTYALGFYSTNPSNTGGGTYTLYEGFTQAATTAPATVRGFRGLLSSNANRWNLYMDGTAQNWMAGSVGIGSGKSAPAVALDVNGVGSFTGVQMAGVLLCNSTAPTISSGFGSSPSVASNNGSCIFTINVGTGGTASSGVIGLPTATTGWSVKCNDNTTMSTTVFITKQTATTTTTATVGNFSTAGVAAAWAASDVLSCSAMAY